MQGTHLVSCPPADIYSVAGLEGEAGGWREAAPPWLLPAGRTNKLSKCSAGSQVDNHFAD